jgi:hypothetical protein
MPDNFPYAVNSRSESFAERRLPALPGAVREAADWVAAGLAPLGLPPARLERLQGAVTDAVLNSGSARPDGAEAHGAGSLLLRLSVAWPVAQAPATELAPPAPASPSRGWGFFLVQRLVASDDAVASTHLIELVLYQEGGPP